MTRNFKHVKCKGMCIFDQVNMIPEIILTLKKWK